MGSKFNIRTAHGKFLCATPEGLFETRDVPGPWEEFELVPVGERPAVVPDSTPPAPPPEGKLGMTIGEIVRIADGPFHPRKYSYWPSSFVTNDGRVLTFASTKRDTVPRMYSYDGTQSLELDWRYPFNSETEGWYFDSAGRINAIAHRSLLRWNAFSVPLQVETLFTSTQVQTSALWQAHSSDDGLVHSATVLDVNYKKVGTAYRRRDGETRFIPAVRVLDESILTKDGNWLLIIETNVDGSDRSNAVFHVPTGRWDTVSLAKGALGHLDVGWDFFVGADTTNGKVVEWTPFIDDPAVRIVSEPLFDTWNMGHVAVQGNYALFSDATIISLYDLTSRKFTHSRAHGVSVSDYDTQVRADFDPSGRIATWVNGNDGSLNIMRVR